MSREGVGEPAGTGPPSGLEKYCPVAGRAGADGRLSRGLRLGTRGRLSRRWRRVLENLVGRVGLHDDKGVVVGLDRREKGRRFVGVGMTLHKQMGGKRLG